MRFVFSLVLLSLVFFSFLPAGAWAVEPVEVMPVVTITGGAEHEGNPPVKTVTVKAGEEAELALRVDSTGPANVIFLYPPRSSENVEYFFRDNAGSFSPGESTGCYGPPCTNIKLVVKTKKPGITSPNNFPVPVDGAMPGMRKETFLASITSAGERFPVRFGVKIVSGEIGFFWAKAKYDSGGISFVWPDQPGVNLKQGETIHIMIILKKFAHDALAPDSVTPSSTLTGEGVAGITVTPLNEKCLVGALPADCIFAIAADPKAQPGTSILTFFVKGEERAQIPVTVATAGVSITEFRPLFSSKNSLRAVCKATIDPAVLSPEEQQNPPTPVFTLRYKSVERGKGSVFFEEAAPDESVKKTAGEYTVERKFLKGESFMVGPNPLLFECSAYLRTHAGDFETTKRVYAEPELNVRIEREEEGYACEAETNGFTAAIDPTLEARQWIRLSVTDISTTVLEKKYYLPTSSYLSLPFVFSDVEKKIKPGGRFFCDAEIILASSAGATPFLTITDKKEGVLRQSCSSPGFGGPVTIKLIGVGMTKEQWDERAGIIASAFEKDKLFAEYKKGFSLVKVEYPYPEKPVSIDDVRRLGSRYLKYCGGTERFRVFDAVAPLAETAGQTDAETLRTITIFSPASEVLTIFRHEMGHAIGSLSDDYISPYSNDPHYRLFGVSCSESIEQEGEGAERRDVCPAWKAWPEYAACIPGCTTSQHYRSTQKSVMQGGSDLNNKRFSVVQCAYLKEELDHLFDYRNAVNFEEGMEHCIAKRDVYGLTWEAAHPV